MGKTFKGKISVDIRDSVPDWTPFLPPKAPEGAPTFWCSPGTMCRVRHDGRLRRSGQAPNMRRIAEAGVRNSNFHTTALCSPTRASPLTGRNATSNAHGDDRRVRLRLPGHLGSHPVRERVHLRGFGRAGLQHRTGGGSVGRGTLHRLRNRLRGVLVRIGRLKAAGASEPPNRWLGTCAPSEGRPGHRRGGPKAWVRPATRRAASWDLSRRVTAMARRCSCLL